MGIIEEICITSSKMRISTIDLAMTASSVIITMAYMYLDVPGGLVLYFIQGQDGQRSCIYSSAAHRSPF